METIIGRIIHLSNSVISSQNSVYIRLVFSSVLTNNSLIIYALYPRTQDYPTKLMIRDSEQNVKEDG